MDEDEEKKIERLMGDLQFFADNFEHINGDQLGKRDEEAVRLRREKDDLRWKLAAEKRRSAELDKVVEEYLKSNKRLVEQLRVKEAEAARQEETRLALVRRLAELSVQLSEAHKQLTEATRKEQMKKQEEMKKDEEAETLTRKELEAAIESLRREKRKMALDWEMATRESRANEEAWRRKRAELEDERASLKERLGRLRERMGRREEEAELFEAEREEFKKGEAERRAHLERLQAQLAEVKAALAQRGDEAARRENERLRAENEALVEQMKKVKEAFAGLP